MTPETLLNRIADKLTRGPVDAGELVASYYPHDMEAGALVERVFRAGLVRGSLRYTHFDCEGTITGIADNTRPVWH